MWEWTARRNEIRVDPVVEATLGLKGGVLSSKIEDFLTYVHPGDKDRFQFMLLSVEGERRRQPETAFPHAPCGQLLSLVRARRRHRAARPTAAPLRCIGLLRDITDEKRAQERLMHDAVHDSLTGLPNRELFLDRLGVPLVRAKDEPAVRPTLIYCDLDKFKSVNSSFGLIVGDSLLLTVSRRLARALQPQDTLARIGGDQFGLLITRAHRTRARSPALPSTCAIPCARRSALPDRRSCSPAPSASPSTTAAQENAQDLLREAETAMSRAKRSGSDRVEIFKPEMRADRDQRVAIESELRRAIEQRQLDIAYQPIIALSTEELVGFEALVRWEHPRLGTLAPAEFIPVAEETDLIVRLGSYVLGRAVADIARWQKELPRPDDPLFMSVNISSRQLMTPDLIQEVRHVVGRNVLARGSLRLEITESLVMENPEQATHILAQLKDAGAGLALDDFGTGYSSLSYLDRFPFDVIKIDRSLVQASSPAMAPARPSCAPSSRSSHELGKRVVAEGVEFDRGCCLPALHRLRDGAGLLLRRADARARCAASAAAHPQGRPAHAPSRSLRGRPARSRRDNHPAAPHAANGRSVAGGADRPAHRRAATAVPRTPTVTSCPCRPSSPSVRRLRNVLPSAPARRPSP